MGKERNDPTEKIIPTRRQAANTDKVSLSTATETLKTIAQNSTEIIPSDSDSAGDANDKNDTANNKSTKEILNPLTSSEQKENTEPRKAEPSCGGAAEPQPSTQTGRIRLVPIEKLLKKPITHGKPLEEPSERNQRSDQAPKLSNGFFASNSVEEVDRKVLPRRSCRSTQKVIIISSSSSSGSSDEDDGTPIQARAAAPKRSRQSSRQLEISSDSDCAFASVPKKKKKGAGQSPSSSIKKSGKRRLSETPVKERDPKIIEPKSAENDRSSGTQPRRASNLPLEGNQLRRGRNRIFSVDSDKPCTSAQARARESSKKVQDPQIKRCVVRIKRCKLTRGVASARPAASKNMGAENNSRNNNSKRRKVSTDSDSDYKDEQEGGGSGGAKGSSDNESEDAKSSDSEIIPTRKRRVFNKKEKSDNDGEVDSDDCFEQDKGKRKRTRLKKNSSDSDDDDDDEKKKNKRKQIRKIIKTKDLDVSTKEAAKEEEERRKRIEERQKIYNKIYEKPDSVEVNELVLDFDEKSKEPLLQVDKGLLKKLKPHQVAGVKFMWDACFETLQDTVEKPGSGCILGHCMGLGKTLQIVTLTHTLLVNSRKTNVERVMIISPLSTLNNWAREFVYWMNFAHKKNIEIYDVSRFKDKPTRIFKLNEWFEEGGVCVLGYDMYRILANEKAKGLRKKQRETLQKVLVDPGPDMVVCDEGHLLKNEKTSISKAVSKMRTKRRIVLTGTPLQNNLKEYYCMIHFVKPNLLGTYKEYMNRFVNPITNGQYTDSTERDIRLMKHRSHILHKMLEGCMQRRDYSVLAPYLPPKYEYVIYVTLSDLQQQLYEHYMTTQRDLINSDAGSKGARLFQDFQDLRRIWTHPMNLRVNSDSVIRKRLLENDDASMDDFICDEDEEEDLNESSSESSVDSSKSFASDPGNTAGSSGNNIKRRQTRNGQAEEGDSEVEEVRPLPPEEDPSEWWKRFVDDKELININHSHKLVFLMRLLEQCEAIGDKLLVFSQSLQSIDVIEKFLAFIDKKTRGQEIEANVGDFKGLWKTGIDYFRLDGSCSVENREAMCKKFNDSKNLRARLFLISTRAGGLGINLVAANRVVIFDVSWNPSHDTQSIFRVYRFGQEKPCYIYRLIAMGTMEQKVYERQVTKQATAKRVIDEQQISRHYNQSDLQELYTYELKPSKDREIPILPKDRLFAELLTEQEQFLFKYHEHDSLLENEESENLNEEERKAAWEEYEAEKTRTVQTAQYMSYDRGAFGGMASSNFGNPSGSVTTSKIFGFRTDVLLQLLNMKVAKDNPEMNSLQVTQLVPVYLQRLYEEMNNDDPTMYRELYTLHQTLARPSGMYMNPLLYVNQEIGAAGYPQRMQQQQQQEQQQLPQVSAAPAPGFEANTVYEID